MKLQAECTDLLIPRKVRLLSSSAGGKAHYLCTQEPAWYLGIWEQAGAWVHWGGLVLESVEIGLEPGPCEWTWILGPQG